MVIPTGLEVGREPDAANGGQIYVAYDGGASSEAALQWAAQHAHLLVSPLTLVYVDDGVTVLPERPLTEDLVRSAARQLEDRAGRIRVQYPELQLATEVVRGEGLREMLELSGPATLLVVGAGEHRILHHPARWSLCFRLVEESAGPIVVVPSTSNQRGRGVIVGVDGDEESRPLAEYAALVATGLEADLRIIHAWLPPMMMLNPYPLDTATMVLVEEPHRQFTTDLTAAVQQAHPEIHVSGTTVRSHPAAALITADPPPELVVVGRRPRSALHRTILGSTSRDVILNLAAPTIVVPSRRTSPVTSTG